MMEKERKSANDYSRYCSEDCPFLLKHGELNYRCSRYKNRPRRNYGAFPKLRAYRSSFTLFILRCKQCKMDEEGK